jgi:hypothetical protein
MLLPQLHDELTRVASAAHPVLRFSGRTASALSAALIALLLAAPAAQAQLTELTAIATTHLRGVL